MRKHRWITVSAFLALASAPLPAAADESAPVAAKGEPGYSYNFSDDPCSAAGMEPIGARIQVARGAARVTLIRPRTAFVVELLKTVEHL